MLQIDFDIINSAFEIAFLQNEPNLILFYFTKAWPETLEDPRQLDEEMRLTHLSCYEDWLDRAFGHEVRIQQAAWFFIMTAIGGIPNRLLR